MSVGEASHGRLGAPAARLQIVHLGVPRLTAILWNSLHQTHNESLEHSYEEHIGNHIIMLQVSMGEASQGGLGAPAARPQIVHLGVPRPIAILWNSLHQAHDESLEHSYEEHIGDHIIMLQMSAGEAAVEFLAPGSQREPCAFL